MQYLEESEKILVGKNLQVLDPDLSLLASEAAIDIDNLLSNRAEDFKAMRDLAERLKNSLEMSEGGLIQSLMDPPTLLVLGEAVAHAVGKPYIEKIEDLLTDTFKISDELSSADPLKDIEALKQARDFCMGLSMAVVAYRKSIRDLRQMRPFRKTI